MRLQRTLQAHHLQPGCTCISATQLLLRRHFCRLEEFDYARLLDHAAVWQLFRMNRDKQGVFSGNLGSIHLIVTIDHGLPTTAWTYHMDADAVNTMSVHT